MRAALACLLLAARCVLAAPLALPAPPAASFDPQPGARLPLDAVFVDESGRQLRLGALFGRSPVVLVPGYYSCRNLCSTLFEGVLQALALSGMPAGAYQLAGVSIDPADTPARAAAKKQSYAAILPGGAAGLHLLSGTAAASAAFAEAIGYRYSRDPRTGELAHAAGFVVATADGRVARYFPGVRFDPAELRAAVAGASQGLAANPIKERLLLLCAHFDPASARHSPAALSAVRAVAALVGLALLGWLWRLARRGGRR
jgi:protein SCO1/2